MSSKQYLDTATAVPAPDGGHTTMDTRLLGTLSQSLSTAAIAAFIFAVFVYVPKIQRKIQFSRLPVLNISDNSGEKQRQDFLANAKRIYEQGHTQYKDLVYRVYTDDREDTVVVPSSLLSELRKLPDDTLSFTKFAEVAMEAKYTKFNTESKLTTHVVKSNLTPALPRLTAMVCEEVDNAIREYMPPCEDWTEVCINSKLADVVSKVSGAVFVGKEMAKNPEYLDACSNYTMDLMTAVSAVKRVQPWLRPIKAPRLPELAKLRQRKTAANNLLVPIIAERMHLKATDPNWQEPDDMLQWMINRDGRKESLEEMAALQLSLIFAAIHTTTMTVTNILYTLVSTPEYLEPLREDIRQAMSENGGKITFRALQQMEKLDSYMKEATRVFPTGVTAFGRRVLKGFSLSNGQYIPPGVILETPAAAMYVDGQYYADPEVFDGYRSYKLRSSGKATDIVRNQFVTTNEINLNFGYGRHACPGRFFATNEIKMVLARLILEYDVKMPDGQTERYPQIEIGRMHIPNPTKTLLFKKATF